MEAGDSQAGKAIIRMQPLLGLRTRQESASSKVAQFLSFFLFLVSSEREREPQIEREKERKWQAAGHTHTTYQSRWSLVALIAGQQDPNKTQDRSSVIWQLRRIHLLTYFTHSVSRKRGREAHADRQTDTQTEQTDGRTDQEGPVHPADCKCPSRVSTERKTGRQTDNLPSS